MHSKYVLGWSLFENVTISDTNNPRRIRRYFFFMCDQYNRNSFSIKLFEKLHDFFSSFCVERSSWFVSKYEFRIGN